MTSYFVSLSQPVRQDHTFEEKQYATCWINGDPTGFSIEVHFSNGKKLDGDHFACVVALKSSDGSVVGAASYKCGINAAFFGKTKEKKFNSRIDLTAYDRGRAVDAEIVFEQPNTRDDIAIWKAIAEAAKKIYEVFIEPPPPKPEGPGPRGDRIH